MASANTKDLNTPPPSFFDKLSPGDLQSLGAFIADQVRAQASGQDALGQLSKTNESLARIVGEIQRSNNRENKNYEDRSWFNFDPACAACKAGTRHPSENDEPGLFGHPKAKLIYDVMFCNGILREEWLTPMEVDLCNQFTTSTTAREGQWTATLERDGTRRRLVIMVPYRGMDTRNDLPSFASICLELLYGPAVADPVQQIQMIAELQRRVVELESKLAAPAG